MTAGVRHATVRGAEGDKGVICILVDREGRAPECASPSYIGRRAGGRKRILVIETIHGVHG